MDEKILRKPQIKMEKLRNIPDEETPLWRMIIVVVLIVLVWVGAIFFGVI